MEEGEKGISNFDLQWKEAEKIHGLHKKEWNDDIEYLKRLKENWWKSRDKVLNVAHILDGFRAFQNSSDVIDYFEEPWKWETKIKAVIETEV